jgi:hypothetical protein
MSLEMFIDIILPAALWPWDRHSLYQKWVPGLFPGGKGSRCVGPTTFMCRLSWNLGASTSWNPQDLSRPVMRLLYNVHGLAHRNNILIYICPIICNVTQFILSRNFSTCFGSYFHPSSEAQTTVFTASGICHTVTANCRCRGKFGTGFSVLWVAYATHSTLKPVPALPR